ncbi:hypothetical protein [Enterococcus hirae]|uniref:hypothetical protein n=1 Tax=Enterococcus hirae TaxID=1354 RepID=UPI001376A7D6|nr:hypothetical protein [Enterococcus hirae]NBA56940.1 hypothetical protein [Enterococcus hirae]
MKKYVIYSEDLNGYAGKLYTVRGEQYLGICDKAETKKYSSFKRAKNALERIQLRTGFNYGLRIDAEEVVEG